MHPAVTLAAYYLLRDHYTGGFIPHLDVAERLRVLLRPLAPPDQPVLPSLGLDAAITELEALRRCRPPAPATPSRRAKRRSGASRSRRRWGR